MELKFWVGRMSQTQEKWKREGLESGVRKIDRIVIEAHAYYES